MKKSSILFLCIMPLLFCPSCKKNHAYDLAPNVNTASDGCSDTLYYMFNESLFKVLKKALWLKN